MINFTSFKAMHLHYVLSNMEGPTQEDALQKLAHILSIINQTASGNCNSKKNGGEKILSYTESDTLRFSTTVCSLVKSL